MVASKVYFVNWLAFDILYSIVIKNKTKAIDYLLKIDIWKDSNIQSIDYNFSLFYFSKIIIEGNKGDSFFQLKKYSSKIFIKTLNLELALDIRKILKNEN